MSIFDVPEVLNVQMNEIKKMNYCIFGRNSFEKSKHWTSLKEMGFFS